MTRPIKVSRVCEGLKVWLDPPRREMLQVERSLYEYFEKVRRLHGEKLVDLPEPAMADEIVRALQKFCPSPPLLSVDQMNAILPESFRFTPSSF